MHNFVAIQNSQGIFADGYQPTPLRTGYEQVIAHRTTDIFASTAEKPGKVVEVTKRAIVVRYKDGSEKRVALGKRQGKAAGVSYPHEITTTFKKGDTVKTGDVIAYNRKYFTPDVFNPNYVVLKSGVMCKTALIDNIDTLEDGSAISERIAKEMTTQVTSVKTIQVRFDQSVTDIVKVGDDVDIESILCIIEDPEMTDNPLFDDVSLDTLRRLSAMTPRAKVTGRVTDITCYYHGEYEDLSPSLQTLADQSNKERKLKAKSLGKPVTDGQVDTSFRIKGNALDPDSMAIQIAIEYDVTASTGDKGVFANQLKTVFSRVMSGTNQTESGEDIDAIFGNTSIDDRMVLSPKLMGTTNTLLRVLSKHVAAVYKGETNAKAPKS